MLINSKNFKMMKVKSFLYFFKVESGGMLIGWANLIGCITAFLSCLAAVTFLSLDNSKNSFCSDESSECSAKYDQVLYYIKIATFSMVFVMFLFTAMSYQLIRGIEEKCPKRVEPMMNYYAVMTIISSLCGIVGALSHSTTALVFGCLNGMIFIYAFLVLYSLHDMFENDYQEAVSAHNEFKASKQILKEQILNPFDLPKRTKTPLVHGVVDV